MGTNIVQMTDGAGNIQYPKTNSDAVGMMDGSGNLTTYLNKRITELNISNLYSTQGIGGSNKYDLATAIAQVPAEYRTVVGLKITFINNVTSKPETWKYNGGTFTTTTNWVQGDGSGGNLILAWNTDVATTRKQVLQQERKKLLQISYENANGDTINEQYIGTTFTDTEWAKDANWQILTSKQDVEEIVSKTMGSIEMILSEWKGGTSDSKYFYNFNGREENISTIPGAAQIGLLKIDIRHYVGYTLYVNSQIGANGYNLFVDEDNSVIERWQQTSPQEAQKKVVPNNAVFMLLSNTFADYEGNPRNTNPSVFYIPNVAEIDKDVVALRGDIETLDNEVSKINELLYTQNLLVSWNGGVDKTTKKFYNSNGVVNDLTGNSGASYLGAGKVDVSEFEGVELEINSYTGKGLAYNLFVDKSGSVLDSWQTDILAAIVKKTVPVGAKSLLLSNAFYKPDFEDSNSNPYVRLNLDESILSKLPKIIKDTEKVSTLLSQKVNLSDINTYIGDTLQLFKYAMFMLADYSAYNIDISVDTTNTTDRKMGKNLERYFEFIGKREGTFPIYVSVSDRNLNVLFEGSFNINVLPKTNPSTPKNILLIGDSETEGVMNNSGISASENGLYPYSNEVKGLLSNRESDNVTPAGINLTNIRLIGTKNTANGRNEGYGGWTANNFMGSGSPFWIDGKIDFNAYLAQDKVYDDTSYKGVDYIYILLGANNTSNKAIVDGVLTISKDEYRTQIISFLKLIKEQLIEGEGTYKNSNLRVVLLNYAYPYISGKGYHPYGSGKYEAGILTAKSFEECGNINDDVAQMEEFSSFVSSVRIANQVDSEYGFVYIEKQINSRMSETEKVSVEQVHFNSMAYKQYGQGVVRDLLGRLV